MTGYGYFLQSPNRSILILFVLFIRMLNEGSDVDHEELQPLANEVEISKNDEKLPQHTLWVEKYTPKYFTELLSDDVSRKLFCGGNLFSTERL